MKWEQYKEKGMSRCHSYSWRNNISHLVYFITDTNGMIKIGITASGISILKRSIEKEHLISAVVVRLKQIQTGNPNPLKIYRIIYCKDSWMAFEIERLLHEKFKYKRGRGEWFDFLTVKHFIDNFTVEDRLFLNADAVFDSLSQNPNNYSEYLYVEEGK